MPAWPPPAGKQVPPGEHSRTPTSPAGDTRLEQAGENTVTDNGYTYTWTATMGCYRTRIPPDPHNPPGEWAYLFFYEDEGFDKYEMYAHANQPIWTETGRDVSNG